MLMLIHADHSLEEKYHRQQKLKKNIVLQDIRFVHSNRFVNDL